MEASFLDTPRGIFTASGTWFRTTEASLKEYAGPVIEHEPVERLMAMAERWLRSPATIVVWIFPILLWYLGIWPAVLLSLGIYVLFAAWGPVIVSYWAHRYLRILDHVLPQAVWYISSMSFFAMMDRLDLMAAGLILFVFMRWGLVAKALDFILKRLHKALYAVPYPDQVLKSVILRSAMKHRVAMPELDRIERFILSQIQRK